MGIRIVEFCAVIALMLILWRLSRFAMRAALRVRTANDKPLALRDRVLRRYEPYGFHAWMFAWFKTRLDSMFDELPEMLRPLSGIQSILDLGCGFGIAGTILLECFEKATIYAIDPNIARVRAASLIFGDRGHVFRGAAPDFELPGLPERFDAVFFLDVLHFLPDPALDLTLARIRDRLKTGDYLFIRAPMKPAGPGSVIWNAARIHRMFTGSFAQYRTADQVRDRIEKAGFEVVMSQLSGNNPELHWFISTAAAEKKVERLVLEPVPAMGKKREQDHPQHDDRMKDD